jgi:hypothetical protein
LSRDRKRLSLSDWASIAEIIGAIAVIFSLLYVGVQVQENTSEVRASNRQALIDRSSDAVLGVAGNPELAQAISKSAAGAPLAPAELTQYQYFVRGMLYDIQEAFLLHEEGRLDDEYWHTRVAIVLAYMSQEPARAVFDRDKALGVLHADYVRWLDSILVAPESN